MAYINETYELLYRAQGAEPCLQKRWNHENRNTTHPTIVLWASAHDDATERITISTSCNFTEAINMSDLYDDGAIDYFEDNDELDSGDAGFMRGYLAA